MDREPVYWVHNKSSLYQTVETVTIPPGVWPVYDPAPHIRAAIEKQSWAEIVSAPADFAGATVTGPTDTASSVPVEEITVESIGPPVEDEHTDEAVEDLPKPPRRKRGRPARRRRGY